MAVRRLKPAQRVPRAWFETRGQCRARASSNAWARRARSRAVTVNKIGGGRTMDRIRDMGSAAARMELVYRVAACDGNYQAQGDGRGRPQQHDIAPGAQNSLVHDGLSSLADVANPGRCQGTRKCMAAVHGIAGRGGRASHVDRCGVAGLQRSVWLSGEQWSSLGASMPCCYLACSSLKRQ